MASSNGAAADAQFEQVIAALNTMQSSQVREEKHRATEFLEHFQKSPEAWTFGHAVLQSQTTSVEAKLFAASTLKGKITYDLHQLPRDSLTALRDSLISLLVQYQTGVKPIRTQLCVCLAGLALQMLEWRDVLDLVVQALGTDAQSSVVLLEFLTVLPEEVTEGRRVSLSEDELAQRTSELLTDNGPKVLQLLNQYAQTTAAQPPNPALITCLNSWLREIACSEVVKTPLVDVVVRALDSETAFDQAVDCLCTMFRETREVDESHNVIEILYPRVIALRPKIASAANEEDTDLFKGITRIFAEAGEAWVVLIARMPMQFRGLVEAIEECARLDKERDVISLTFNFWYELKNYLVLESYAPARIQLLDVWTRLVDIMIMHLQYPQGSEEDPFDGDREMEEKFREFRHSMGDVLKDCCEVVGSAECLQKSFEKIQAWMHNYVKRSPLPGSKVANWQELEAPLFSLRAMGRMVPKDEDQVLPQIMSSLVQLPEHEKVRFAATLVLGRYTEWTAKHPDYLQLQLDYIINGFKHPSKDVTKAAAMALKFFCQDCGKLLVDYVGQLHQFYEQVAPELPLPSLYEITDGVAHVVAAQPLDKIYDALRLFCEPIALRLMESARTATDKEKKCQLADHIQLLTIFVQYVHPHVPPGQPNPMVRFWAEMFPVMSGILDGFVDFLPICERVSRFYRAMLTSYRTDMAPLLPQLAEKLVSSFETSHQGCFLWVSGTVVREFGDEEFVDETTRNSVYQFLERQIMNMFKLLNTTAPKEIPDVIEDFFRLLGDATMFHPFKLLRSTLLQPIFEAALVSLELEQTDPLISVLQFMRDLLAYGREAPPTSTHRETPEDVRTAIKAAAAAMGERITRRILSGLMYSFPSDCVTDSSGVMLELVELVPQQVLIWIKETLELLPQGSVSPEEAQKFLTNIESAATNKEWSKIRYTLRDFTAWYRRKNVTPRSEITGIAGAEGPRFRYGG
ncbi:ARM repeat-containing protein [Ascodesmis nigricans]|uniref:ARM repeat-containing protein n=1 Tax=Ascodesmis nigricans TaxID=341454 RepID=A0A4S2N1I9_9PEZI|nr:ARM repeat-containing protein [Ascodesmis nigricans]